MIKVLICWELEEEIDRALEVREKIHHLLDKKDLHSGISTTNHPPKTFGLEIKRV